MKNLNFTLGLEHAGIVQGARGCLTHVGEREEVVVFEVRSVELVNGLDDAGDDAIVEQRRRHE